MHKFTRIDGGKGDVDLEAGGGSTLYPGLSHGENELRWGFVRKVYGILCAQVVLTTVVSAATVLYTPMNDLLRDSSGLALILAILPLILLCPLYHYQQRHPLNFVFLGLFTVCLSLSIGVACANTQGKIVLEALILTSGVVASLTGYTFWASKKGKDFSYLGPILFAGLVVLLLTTFIQVNGCLVIFSNPCCADVLPSGPRLGRGLRWTWCHPILRFPCVRHGQLDQALHLRRIRVGVGGSLPRHPQPLPLHSQHAQGHAIRWIDER